MNFIIIQVYNNSSNVPPKQQINDQLKKLRTYKQTRDSPRAQKYYELLIINSHRMNKSHIMKSL